MVDRKVAKRGRRRNVAATRVHSLPRGAETQTPIPLLQSRSRMGFHLYPVPLGKCSACNHNPDCPARERLDRSARPDGHSGADSNCRLTYPADPVAHRYCTSCTVTGTRGQTQSKSEPEESGTSHQMLSGVTARVNVTSIGRVGVSNHSLQNRPDR